MSSTGTSMRRSSGLRAPASMMVTGLNDAGWCASLNSDATRASMDAGGWLVTAEGAVSRAEARLVTAD